MSQQDRLFLEECCPTLSQKLALKLVDKPDADLPEQDVQDFEVGYSISSVESVLQLKIKYPFLSEVLQNGSQALLERVWQGIPLKLSVEPGVLTVGLDVATLSEDVAERQRCAQALACSRTWLLIGPLIERLRWLRDNVAAGAGAKSSAPDAIELRVRQLETCWIITKPDRVLVIFSVHLDDEVDVTLGRTFCQEFAEARGSGGASLPCSFSEPKDVPTDLRPFKITALPNVGFMGLTISNHVENATEDRLYALARPVMTFRNFFQFHLKMAKSYLHSRLRVRLNGWVQQVNLARRKPKKGQEKRRTFKGKEFIAPSDKVAP